MATLHAIERNDIRNRRSEADSCLHFGLYHAATLTAGSGIELLLELLVYELHQELRQNDPPAAKKLRRKLEDEESRNRAKTKYWGLRSWIRFYDRYDVIDTLEKCFNYQFRMFNKMTLSETNQAWNRCKHDVDFADAETGNTIVLYLNAYLEESDFQQDEDIQQQMTVDAVGRHWLKQWSRPLMLWVSQNPNEPKSDILFVIEPFLDLILRLIDDKRVEYQHKTPLMVAANYVFSDVDLIPESNIDVHGLVDDGAVLTLTLYWLLQQQNFDKSIIFGHWPGGDALVAEVERLKAHIWTEQERLFPEARWQMGSGLVWRVIERIAETGPEALWQNYWKEQFRTEIP